MADVIAAYLEFAKRFYSGADGKATREVDNVADGAVTPRAHHAAELALLAARVYLSDGRTDKTGTLR